MRVAVYRLFFVWFAMTVQAEQTQPLQSGTEQTTLNRTQQEAERWGLSVEDWSRYERIMQGPRGRWSPNLDPVTALGVSADSESERQRYAELLVRIERDRTQHELAFEKAVQQAKRKLFPADRLLDSDALQALVQERRGAPAIQAGDRLLLFVNLDCKACNTLLWQLVRELQSTPSLHLDVYVTGHASDPAIQSWAAKLKLPPALVNQNRLTLNHDRQTLARLVADPLQTVPVLVRQRGQDLQQLPTDPVAVSLSREASR